MTNGDLTYGSEELNVLLKTGIDNIFNKANGKGLDNILLEYYFKILTLMNGTKNFQMVTSIADLGITNTTFTFQNIVDNVPEQSICWFEIPATADIVGNQAGQLLMINAPWWNKSAGTKPLPQLAFFMAKESKILWYRYYNGVGGDSNWFPLNRYKTTPVLDTTNFTGRLELWQNGNVLWLTGAITNVNPINDNLDKKVGSFGGVYAPDYSIATPIEINNGLAVSIITGNTIKIRRATMMATEIPAGTTFYISQSWISKCME